METADGRACTARSHRGGEGRQAVAAVVRAQHGGARAHGADGDPDAWTFSGVARAQRGSAYKPTKRGGGGALKVLWWQGATLLNPHFAIGTKDQDGSRIFYEPLAGWDPDGDLLPMLAAEIPSRENGGLAADGKSVTWKLKRGVHWHDGKPFTADDVRLQLGIRLGPGDRLRHDRQLQGRQGREGRRPSRSR